MPFNDLDVLAVIAVVALVTVVLRATPFFAMRLLSRNHYLSFLGERMPVGVMVLLVAYTFKDVDFTSYPYGLPPTVSVLVALLFHWLTANALLSIGLGLACHLLIVNVIV